MVIFTAIQTLGNDPAFAVPNTRQHKQTYFSNKKVFGIIFECMWAFIVPLLAFFLYIFFMKVDDVGNSVIF